MSKELSIFIPLLPPGINQTYGIKIDKAGKPSMYKRPKAITWSVDASLIIGAKAAEVDFEFSKYYEIYIEFNNWRMDVDAPIKLIIDTVSQKLGFDDKYILKQTSVKKKGGEKSVLIVLKGIDSEECI